VEQNREELILPVTWGKLHRNGVEKVGVAERYAKEGQL
jgi:hypothetical protein